MNYNIMEIITLDLNYYNKINFFSITNYTNCLKIYSENFNAEVGLESETPIFLDTNILLRYYSISFAAREKLYNFIDKNKNRIILSAQVQYEFLKNREEIIQKFFEQVTNRIPKDFKVDISNKLKSFLETHKIVLKDYPFVEAGIKKHQEELESILQKLHETSEEKRKENINLIVNDKFLDLLCKISTLNTLSSAEMEIVKKTFDDLKKNIKPEQVDSKIEKNYSVFPGLGDIKEKPENPYGDYIIYHEIMKYMVEKKSDVIFLTFDNSKGDWMTKDKTPHMHYIQNAYANTKQILYILDAERLLKEILDIDIESLVKTKEIENEMSVISTENLTNLCKEFEIFNGREKRIFRTDIIKELELGGYNSIDEIRNDLIRGQNAFVEYEKDSGAHLSTLGVLRITLRIVNPHYKYIVKVNGQINEAHEVIMSKAARYRKYIIN